MKNINILISKEQLDFIVSEAFQKKQDLIANKIRDLLRQVYEPKKLWGKIQDPENNCETGEGVIGVYPHLEGQDNWSILNRFDTNSLVRNRMKEIFREQNPAMSIDNDNEFIKWMGENKNDLFDGKYTQELVDLNKTSVEKGNKNEQYVVDILQERFPNAKIKRFCSGSIQDTRKGMDISIEVNNNLLTAQVKPFSGATMFVDESSNLVYYRVYSPYFDAKKYSPRNVDIFFFVNREMNEYIAFINDRSKIKTSQKHVDFFESKPLVSNIQTYKQKKPRTDKKMKARQELTKNLFQQIIKNSKK